MTLKKFKLNLIDIFEEKEKIKSARAVVVKVKRYD